MSTNPHKGGSFYGDAAHYRSRFRFFLSLTFVTKIFCINWICDNCSEGLTTRPVASSDEIQLHIDPGIDFDDEITGLRGQVRRLRNVFHYLYIFLFLYPLFSFLILKWCSREIKLRMFLPQVAEDIGTEVKYQRDFLEQVVCNFFSFCYFFSCFEFWGGEECGFEGLGFKQYLCFRRFKFYSYWNVKWKVCLAGNVSQKEKKNVASRSNFL